MLGPIGRFEALNLKEVKIGKYEKKRIGKTIEKVKESCSL